MVTLEQVIERLRSGINDVHLKPFLTREQLIELGEAVPEDHVPAPWTQEEVMRRIAFDLERAFDSAAYKKGISAWCNFNLMRDWMWVLEDDVLVHWSENDFGYYGLPLYKAIAVKYDLPNDIGEDAGTEERYR